MKKLNFSFVNGMALDLSTANEGLYKMLDKSKRTVRPVEDEKYVRVELGEWVESTVRFVNDAEYPGFTTFMSDSNKGKNSSIAKMKVVVKGYNQIEFVVGAYSERNYDYVVVFAFDYEPDVWSYAKVTDASRPILCHTKGELYPNGPTKGFIVGDIDPNKESFFWVVYRKDESGSTYDDRGYFAIKLEN